MPATAKLECDLAAYARAACAAGVSALALASASEARIIYTPAHTKISPNHAVTLDLDHDDMADFTFRDPFSTTSVGFFREGALSIVPEHANEIWGQTNGVGGHYASALPAGVRVSTRGAFSQGSRSLAYGGREGTSVFCEGKWYGARRRYLGLKFDIKGKTHFAWARLNVTCGPPNGKTRGVMTGYAYETKAQKAIVTGDKGHGIYPPASLGRLALGTAGK